MELGLIVEAQGPGDGERERVLSTSQDGSPASAATWASR